jgi:hypothetical protein
VVEDNAGGHAESTLAPFCRERDVRLYWKNVRKALESERCLVRENARPLGPEPDDGQLLMFARGEVDEPVDSAAHSRDATAADVL